MVSSLFAAALTLCVADPVQVLVLGDSLTEGYGLTKKEAFPALLERKASEEGLESAVVNGGLSGDTSAGGLRRIAWLLKRNRPDILLLALGANDGLRGQDTEALKKNLREIIDKTKAHVPSVKIILAGMRLPENMGKDYTARFVEVFPEVAKETDAVLIPFLLEGVAGEPRFNLEDRIHPNAEGQKRIATYVWKFLKPEIVAAQSRRLEK